MNVHNFLWFADHKLKDLSLDFSFSHLHSFECWWGKNVSSFQQEEDMVLIHLFISKSLPILEGLRKNEKIVLCCFNNEVQQVKIGDKIFDFSFAEVEKEEQTEDPILLLIEKMR